MPHDCAHHAMPSSASGSFHKAFGISIALNALFVMVEAFIGLHTLSLALVADALHNLGDVLGLILAWIGYYFAQRAPSERFTFGLGRLSIFATVLNGAFLVISAIFIVYEAISRWGAPPPEATNLIMLTAFIGILINAGTALALMRGKHDINIKGAYLHMLADAGVSAAVIVAALLIGLTGWGWIDLALAVMVAILILWSSWPLMVEGLKLAIDGVPSHVNHKDIKDFILSQSAVIEVNDLRIWALSTTKTALTAHVVVTADLATPDLLKTLHHALQHQFNLASVTLQIEDTHHRCVTSF